MNGVPIVKGSEVLTDNLPGRLVRPGWRERDQPLTCAADGWPLSGKFTETAARVRNWGRWGDDDQLGTLNLIDDAARAARCGVHQVGPCLFARARVVRAARAYRSGSFPVGVNPLRTMTHLNTPLSGDPDWICSNEDVVVMGTQAATHWDGLSHVSYDGNIYNGYPASSVTASGSVALRDPPGPHAREPRSAPRCRAGQGRRRAGTGLPDPTRGSRRGMRARRTSVVPGDIVLVRTGQMVHLGLDRRRRGISRSTCPRHRVSR